MGLGPFNLLLADDDIDDCPLFQEALEELEISSTLTTVHDGDQLIQFLFKKINLIPDVLFLDLNMPRKDGLQCLSEIKNNSQLSFLPVIIYSTSFESSVITHLYQGGAQYYIRKPAEFCKIKELLYHVLILLSEENITPPTIEHFILGEIIPVIP